MPTHSSCTIGTIRKSIYFVNLVLERVQEPSKLIIYSVSNRMTRKLTYLTTLFSERGDRC